ncbi:MAG: hypothetical protein ABIH34_02710 [Nanoarchaeota archaeon]
MTKQTDWHFLCLVSETEMTEEFLNEQRERFLEIKVKDASYGDCSGENYYSIEVQAHPEIPAELVPGGGFIQFGRRKPEEAINNDYLHVCRRKFKQINGIDVTSVVVLPGPYYHQSAIVPGQFEKISSYDKIVWMR